MASKTGYDYIEGWPYVVTWGEYEAARFPAGENGKANAKTYAHNTGGRLVDTTPAPRIPGNAKFIYWIKNGDFDYYARKGVDGMWRLDSGALLTEDQMLECWIDEEEITVLDPR